MASIREWTVRPNLRSPHRPIEPLFQGADGHEVRQGLCGMLMTAVAAVDDRDSGGLFCDHGGAFLGMTDGGNVSETGDGADSISDALSLGDGGTVRVGEAHHGAAHVQHGGLCAQTRAGGGLVEERCKFLSMACISVFFRICLDVCRDVENGVEFAYRKIQRCQNMAHRRSFL